VKHHIRTWTLGSLAGVIILTSPVMVWGAHRYDGLGNFFLRLYAEVQARRPHPDFVPTPFVAGSVDFAAEFHAAPTIAPSGLESTSRPTPSRLMPTVAVKSVVISAAVKQAATARPTNTPRPTPSPTAAPIATARNTLPDRVQLTGLRHSWQTWNNCGPATLAMNLSYFGSKLTQADVAATLRPYRDDKNTGPDEMAAYARSQGLRALVRVNGDAGRLKALLAAGIPVLIETWYEPEPNDGMGHYRLLVGYDDAAQEWLVYDSYEALGLTTGAPIYTGIRIPYDEVARLWEAFNRTYLVIYDDARRAAVEAVLGNDLDDAAMWGGSLETARAAVQAQPKNAFAWFNAGTSLLALGRADEAAWAYDQARQVGLPWRMLWYQFGPLEAYYSVGRYDEVIALTNATLRHANIEELYTWRGLAELAKGDANAARGSFQRALQFNAGYAPAAAAMQSLAAPAP
jgi:tetratricopeptide (TPR) repeat protein